MIIVARQKNRSFYHIWFSQNEFEQLERAAKEQGLKPQSLLTTILFDTFMTAITQKGAKPCPTGSP